MEAERVRCYCCGQPVAVERMVSGRWVYARHRVRPRYPRWCPAWGQPVPEDERLACVATSADALQPLATSH